MVPRFIAIVFAFLILGLLPAAPSVASAPTNGSATTQARAQEATKNRKGKACPTKNFWLGAGWGVDRGSRSHKGVDLGGKRGTPIFAVEAGQINRTKRQKDTIVALGIKKLNNPVEHEATPQIMGMIRKVSHLVKVETK